jgi:hypothetical protein
VFFFAEKALKCVIIFILILSYFLCFEASWWKPKHN